jgi:hypothetical protein
LHAEIGEPDICAVMTVISACATLIVPAFIGEMMGDVTLHEAGFAHLTFDRE